MNKYYRTELHTHTKPVSECGHIEAKQLVEIYKQNGYDSIVITNHFMTQLHGETVEKKVEWYLSDYCKCAEAGKELDLNVILGAEITFTESKNDYLVFGICPEDLVEIYKMLPYGIERFYREFKNEKNVIIQAHPFRDGMERANLESVDGIEVFNMGPGLNSRIGLAARFASENNMIATCGSDVHLSAHACLCSILTRNPLKDSYEVADVLKSRDYVMTVGDFQVTPMPQRSFI